MDQSGRGPLFGPVSEQEHYHYILSHRHVCHCLRRVTSVHKWCLISDPTAPLWLTAKLKQTWSMHGAGVQKTTKLLCCTNSGRSMLFRPEYFPLDGPAVHHTHCSLDCSIFHFALPFMFLLMGSLFNKIRKSIDHKRLELWIHTLKAVRKIT